MNIAILGFGTVGSGVYQILLEKQNKYHVKYVLVRRSTPSLLGVKVTQEFQEILEDETVETIIEVMGGILPAFDYIKAALSRGKNVISANKDLMAQHGVELLELAKKNNVKLLYDASVMGGTPAFEVTDSLARSNRILSMKAILNGTCNFILSKMSQESLSFSEALGMAQALGYAEADPSADVQGTDTMRKLSLLTSLAYQQSIDMSQLSYKGIEHVSDFEIRVAKSLGMSIKLIASTAFKENTIFMSVYPTMIKESSALGQVEGSNNGLVLTGNNVGKVGVFGPGAGSLPTASAVVSDLALLERSCESYPFGDDQTFRVKTYRPEYVLVRRFRDEEFAGIKCIDINDNQYVGWIVKSERIDLNGAFIALDESVEVC